MTEGSMTMAEMSMLEKVARALAFSDGSKMTGPSRHKASDQFGWDPAHEYRTRYVEANWPKFVNDARFAIEAMREPTRGMRAAGKLASCLDDIHLTSEEAGGIWTAMANAALSEEVAG